MQIPDDTDETLREHAVLLPLDEPPAPWGNRFIIHAAGIFASGWDAQDNLWLFSMDGYSRTSLSTRIVDFMLTGHEIVFALLDTAELHFTIPNTKEVINVFGVRSGDGVHITQEGWLLEVIYPEWPNYKVTLHQMQPGRSFDQYLHMENIYGIKLDNIDGDWVRCRFSPSGLHFAIIGEPGAEVFSREES